MAIVKVMAFYAFIYTASLVCVLPVLNLIFPETIIGVSFTYTAVLNAHDKATITNPLPVACKLVIFHQPRVGVVT